MIAIWHAGEYSTLMALFATPALAPPAPAPNTGYEHQVPLGTASTSSRSAVLPSMNTPRGAAPQDGESEGPQLLAASVVRRVLASLLDLSLVIPVCGVAGLLLCLALGQPLPRLAELSPDLLLATLLDGNRGGQGLLLLSGLVLFAYFGGFHAVRGQTPGKQLLGIMVVNSSGRRPGPLRAIGRTLGYLFSALPVSLGFLWVGFDRERRALHDLLADTYVVRVP